MVVERAVEKEADYTIILDELNFRWHKSILASVAKYWNEGLPFGEIVELVNPRPTNGGWVGKAQRELEVALIIVHLRIEGEIKCREGAIWGN